VFSLFGYSIFTVKIGMKISREELVRPSCIHSVISINQDNSKLFPMVVAVVAVVDDKC
jgi:hypothetical protein